MKARLRGPGDMENAGSRNLAFILWTMSSLSLFCRACTEWTYDRSVFTNTIVQEFNLVCGSKSWKNVAQAWLPDGYSQIFRLYLFGPSGLKGYGLRLTAKFDPFLSLDCAPLPSTLAQSKERKESHFAIWQPCQSVVGPPRRICSALRCP